MSSMLSAARKTPPLVGDTSTAVSSASCATAATGGSATRRRRARTCTGWTRPRRVPGTCARATTGRIVTSKGRRPRPRCRGTIHAHRRQPATDVFSRPRSAPSASRRPSKLRARPAVTWRARCVSRARARAHASPPTGGADGCVWCPLCRAPFALEGATHLATNRPLLEALPAVARDGERPLVRTRRARAFSNLPLPSTRAAAARGPAPTQLAPNRQRPSLGRRLREWLAALLLGR